LSSADAMMEIYEVSERCGSKLERERRIRMNKEEIQIKMDEKQRRIKK
jgi:hypothetical protein